MRLTSDEFRRTADAAWQPGASTTSWPRPSSLLGSASTRFRPASVPCGGCTRLRIAALGISCAADLAAAVSKRSWQWLRLRWCRVRRTRRCTAMELRRVLEASARLNDRDAEILRLVSWEALSRDEIAAVLDLAPNAVSQRLNRARTNLTKEYNRLERRSDRSPATRKGGTS